MNTNEYDELRLKFNKVDIKNPKSLHKWFTTNDCLNIHDHSIIIGKSSQAVKRLRKLAGLGGKKPNITKQDLPNKSIGPVDLPPNWKSKEWLSENINRYTIVSLSKSAGVTRNTMYKILLRAGVTFGDRRVSKNPCCTKAWCHRHYVELDLSMNQCSKIAKISQPKFADWLVKFKIPVKSKRAEREADIVVPLFLRILIRKLYKQSIVRKVIVHKAHLQIKFKDGITQRYLYNKITAGQWFISNIPKIRLQYEQDIQTQETYPAHISVSKKELDRSTKFEQDVALHYLNKQLTQRGWIWPRYPQYVLQDDLNNLKSIEDRKMIKKGSIIAYNQIAGRYLMCHFFDLSHLWRDVFMIPKRSWAVMRSLHKKKDLNVNTHNMIHEITRGILRQKLKLPNPALYVTLLRRLGIRGRVLDLNLGTGSRAIACSVTGNEYAYLSNEKMDKAIDLGIMDVCGLKCIKYDDEVVDLVICDNDLTESNIEAAMLYADRAKQIIAYVPREKKDEYKEIYDPKSMIKVITNPRSRDPNYYFIW